MVINYSKSIKSGQYKIGRGFVNNSIYKLLVKLHLPEYQFCGPGIRLEKRSARGDKGIHLIDTTCKEHDIAFHNHMI